MLPAPGTVSSVHVDVDYNAKAAAFAVGDLDGGGRADLNAHLPGFGLWSYMNPRS
jgi:hypothetical protein